MSEVLIVNSFMSGVFLLIALFFLLYIMKWLGSNKLEVERYYSLAEIGFLKKYLEDKIDIHKVDMELNIEYSNKFKKKLEEKIIKKYLEDDKEVKK